MSEKPRAELPTTELVGPAGRVVVNTSDVESYLAKGYSMPGEDKPKKESKPKKKVFSKKVSEEVKEDEG